MSEGQSGKDGEVDAEEDGADGGWFSRLARGLKKSSGRISGGLVAGLGGAMATRRLDQGMLDALEDALISADLGPETAAELVADFGRARFGKDVTETDIRADLALRIEAILAPVAQPLIPDPAHRPHVILVVGVNGSGKTTTIGKLAQGWCRQGKSVVLAAGDTFRAAAIEQLQVWGARAGATVVAGAPGADAAGLAHDALRRAQDMDADILIIDTAGRLHTKAGLMDELAKIMRVIRKLAPDAPHDRLLVLDAGVGQNALVQVARFREVVELSGLIVTKLDGTARGGVLVALARQFGLPVHAVGIGEGAGDLGPFSAGDYARGLLAPTP